MINKELLQFKDEFLKQLREIEIKFEKKLEKQSIIIAIKNQEQEDKINLTIQKNDELLDTMLEQKTKIEKISELYTSQKKLNDMLITHEMRINNLLNDNKKLERNYDKIIIDNLRVPGYIGTSCTFKNLSEYIQNNINEIQRIKNEKENDKKINEDIKNKLDNFIKNMLSLVDNSVNRCNQYTDSKQIYLENILKNKLVEIDEKNMDLRTQLFANISKVNKKVENFGLKLSELYNLKEDVNNEIDIKFKEIIKDFEVTKSDIKQNIQEIIEYKSSLNGLIDKKFDNLIKNQKNNTKFDFNLKKNEDILSSNIKSFRDSNKREEIMNTFSISKSSKNNNLKYKNSIKNKMHKRFTIMNPKTSNRKLLIETKEDIEENKSSIDFDKSNEESINKNDNNNVKTMSNTTNNLLTQENGEKEIKEKEEKKNDHDLKENKTNIIDLNNKINNDSILEKIENEKEIIQIDNNEENKDKKENKENAEIINKSIELKNDNKKNIIDKKLNSYYINNIKTVISQKPILTDFNKENKIMIPKINEKSKNSEKERLSIDFNPNKNIIKKNNLEQNNNKKNEIKYNINKSTNNTFNYIQLSKEKEKLKRKDLDKEKDLKSINSDDSLVENKDLYNTSPQFYSIETQTSKLVVKNKKKSKFPKIGFSYKIINLGSDINFKERNIQNNQNKKDSSKTSIDLSKPLTDTYKAYQKKKNIKKINNKSSLKEFPSKDLIIKHNFLLPKFNNTILNNNSFHKKHYRNIDLEYMNLIKKKNSENEHSIESIKSSKVKIIKEMKEKTLK